MWTYYEWRRAYINIFAGHENTNKDKIPYFDDKGKPIIYHDIIGGIDE